MIKLYQFYPLWNLPNASPFCMKLETYLRMAKLPYEIVKVADPRQGPKGKLPYIEENGQRIGDSGLIIDYLKQKYGDSVDSHLNEKQKAEALLIQRLIEEHLYWIMVYSRWMDQRFWPITKQAFFGHIKGLKGYIITKVVWKKMYNQLQEQGMGRHTEAEVYQLGLDDLQALNCLLGTNPYLMGKEPSSVDASFYGFLANILYPPIPTPLQEYVKSQQNFVDYCERMKKLF